MGRSHCVVGIDQEAKGLLPDMSGEATKLYRYNYGRRLGRHPLDALVLVSEHAFTLEEN